jgi:hypothetical protein
MLPKAEWVEAQAARGLGGHLLQGVLQQLTICVSWENNFHTFPKFPGKGAGITSHFSFIFAAI